MSHILLLTNSTGSSVDVLPALELLNHRVHILPAEPTALLETDPCDIVLLDARKDLVGARSLTQLLKATGLSRLPTWSARDGRCITTSPLSPCDVWGRECKATRVDSVSW